MAGNHGPAYAAWIQEHMGPGPHKSGTPQKIHSGGGAAGMTGGAAGASGAAGSDEAKAKLKEGLANWDTLTQEQKDALADPARTVPARADEILRPLGEWGGMSAGERIKAAMDKGLIVESNGETLQRRAGELDALLTEMGTEAGAARVIQQRFTDLMLAQEVESMERTLGDHGIRHLSGDIQLATALLEEVGLATPHNRLITIMAGGLHDVGYLTPPSRNWKDRDHPRWSGQYLESDQQLSEALTGVLGDEGMKSLRHVIDTHYTTETDWQADPLASAFRVADNMALFHNEKTPGLLKYVPENLKPLEALKAGTMELGAAQAQMRANVASANLPAPVKAQFGKAISEVSPILNKLTPGMRAGQLAGVGKVGGVPTVFVRRTAHYDRVQRLFGVGARQFAKLAEAYKGENGVKGAMDRLWSRGWENFGGFRVEAVNVTRRRPSRRIREGLEAAVGGLDHWLTEHYGPGPHPKAGTPQISHTGGRVARRAHAWARTVKASGKTPAEAYAKGETEAAIKKRTGKGGGEPQSDYARRRLAYEAKMAGKAAKRREWAEKRRQSAEDRRKAVEPFTRDYAFNTQPGISNSPVGRRVNRAIDKAHEDSKMAKRHDSVAKTFDERAAHGSDTGVMQGKIKQAEADMRRAQKALDGRLDYHTDESGQTRARIVKPEGENKAHFERLLKDAKDAKTFWEDRLKKAGGAPFKADSFKKGQTVSYAAGARGEMRGRIIRVNKSSITIQLDPEDIPKHLRGLMKPEQKIPYSAMKRDNTRIEEGADMHGQAFEDWLQEHYGPGPHPGGTPQVSHTGGRVAQRAHAWARLAKSKGKSPAEAYVKGETEAAIKKRTGGGKSAGGGAAGSGEVKDYGSVPAPTPLSSTGGSGIGGKNAVGKLMKVHLSGGQRAPAEVVGNLALHMDIGRGSQNLTISHVPTGLNLGLRVGHLPMSAARQLTTELSKVWQGVGTRIPKSEMDRLRKASHDVVGKVTRDYEASKTAKRAKAKPYEPGGRGSVGEARDIEIAVRQQIEHGRYTDAKKVTRAEVIGELGLHGDGPGRFGITHVPSGLSVISAPRGASLRVWRSALTRLAKEWTPIGDNVNPNSPAYIKAIEANRDLVFRLRDELDPSRPRR